MSDKEIKYNCSYTELVHPSELKPHPKNPNKHPDDQIKRLAKIIKYQGFRHPIIVSETSGNIVAGHGRLEAAKLLGLEKVPVDFQSFESEDEEYAFVVADNAIALWAELDIPQIQTMALDMGPDFDVDNFGIKDFHIVPADGVMPELSDSEPGFQQVTFILSNEQKDILNEAMDKAKSTEDCSDQLNQNQNGNIISAIVKRYVYG